MYFDNRNKIPIKAKKTLSLRPFHYLLMLLSFALVSLGQPAWIWWIGLLTSACGYALFWRVLLDVTSKTQRFWISTGWFTCVQGVQISWMLTHPYNYIFFVYPIFIFLLGLQGGIFGIFIRTENIEKLPRALALAALWTLLEWSRLFFLSGFTWNPAGLALTGSLYSLQVASLVGVFGLSFWVIFVNICALKAWISRPAKLPIILWAALALLPYLFGVYQHHLHQDELQLSLQRDDGTLNALLVQTAFPAEEAIPFNDKQSYISFVIDEWRQILQIMKDHLGKNIDLIALPEYVVPFGAYSFLYPYSYVKSAFEETYGSELASKLPNTEEPFARQYQTTQGDVWFVNNAFWAQGIANIFNAELVTGLEDAEKYEEGYKHYSAAIHFKPGADAETFIPNRYAKRVLLPMAEYIPFSFCRDLAAHYGIHGSFTPGDEAKIIQGCKGPFSLSICYEETFGHLMREGRQNGSKMLVNLTSDVWYPNSRLPQQHADHARLRTVENGIPLLRACNTGVTIAFDSLGRTVDTLCEEGANSEWLAAALHVSVPRYHYETLYSRYGDSLIVGFSCFALLFFFVPYSRKQ